MPKKTPTKLKIGTESATVGSPEITWQCSRCGKPIHPVTDDYIRVFLVRGAIAQMLFFHDPTCALLAGDRGNGELYELVLGNLKPAYKITRPKPFLGDNILPEVAPIFQTPGIKPPQPGPTPEELAQIEDDEKVEQEKAERSSPKPDDVFEFV